MRTSLLIFSALLLLSACGTEPKYSRAERKDITDAVFANGSIVYEHQALVSAYAEGFLQPYAFDEGDSLQKNQPLFQLNGDAQQIQTATAQIQLQQSSENADTQAPRLQQLQRQIDQARESAALDQRNLQRYETLLKSNAVAKIDYDKVRTQAEQSRLQVEGLEKSLADAQKQLQNNLRNSRQQVALQQRLQSDYQINAPSAGIILELRKEAGELVRRGESIARIGSGSLLARLYVAEEDINRIQIGQTAFLSLGTEKGKTYEGRVSKIYPSFDERQQAFVVDITLQAPPARLRNGTQVQANIIVGTKEKALILPANCLAVGDKVYTKTKDTLQLKIGIRSVDWVEVLEGLKEDSELLITQK